MVLLHHLARGTDQQHQARCHHGAVADLAEGELAEVGQDVLDGVGGDHGGDGDGEPQPERGAGPQPQQDVDDELDDVQDDLVGGAGGHDLFLGESVLEVEAVEEQADGPGDAGNETGERTHDGQDPGGIGPLPRHLPLPGNEELGQVGQQEKGHHPLQVQRVDVLDQVGPQQHGRDGGRYEPPTDLPHDVPPEHRDAGGRTGARADGERERHHRPGQQAVEHGDQDQAGATAGDGTDPEGEDRAPEEQDDLDRHVRATAKLVRPNQERDASWIGPSLTPTPPPERPSPP